MTQQIQESCFNMIFLNVKGIQSWYVQHCPTIFQYSLIKIQSDDFWTIFLIECYKYLFLSRLYLFSIGIEHVQNCPTHRYSLMLFRITPFSKLPHLTLPKIFKLGVYLGVGLIQCYLYLRTRS